MMRLPQLSSCGPIEAALGAPCRRGCRETFRNCQVAAPLKPGSADRRRADGMVLPQLSSCGPIEASLGEGRLFVIELLPQLSSCGPIEARTLGAHRRTSAAFRNCQVAAPLKPVGLPAWFIRAMALPQLSSCGPIEARRRKSQP